MPTAATDATTSVITAAAFGSAHDQVTAFSVFMRALGDWWRDWVNMAVLNLAWMLCWLTIVLGPPATFAAYRVANDFANERTLYPRELPGMLRRYFLQSWGWFLLQLLVAAGVLVNLQFYGEMQSGVGAVLQGATLVVAGIWLLLQLYALPYLMEQGQPGLQLALRNALLTALASPLYTLIIGVIVALLLAICVRLPFLLLFGVPMLIAVIGSHAVLERLERFGKRQSRES
ncbi:MAG: hypothetical protein WD273_11985 [Trueperaceae bacterium]